MTDPNAAPAAVADEHLEVVDLFHTAWVKAFIRVNNAADLETVEILLSIGQQVMERVPRRAQHPRLDVVLATMLRPALVAAKAADVNLRHGLYEPALAQVRTVLELDLALEFMLQDPATKDALADRYLAWSRRRRIGPLNEQLTNPALRATLDAKRIAWIEGRLRTYREELAALPAATAQNQADRNWHPHHDVKGLAEHLGRLDDYLQLYAPMSNMNVHAADPETHLDIAPDGTVKIKALATTEPWKVATTLNLLAGILLRFLSRLRDEWALQGTPLDRMLTASQMRFVGPGDGKIPAELRPEGWATAIRVTQAPLAEILEDAVQLLLVLVGRAPTGLTEAELRDMTGMEAMPLGARGHALLRGLLDHLVEVGALRLDAAVEPHRYRAPPDGGALPA
jgi:hypothetical protein